MKSTLPHALLAILVIGWSALSLSTHAAPDESASEPDLLEPENFDSQNPLTLLYHVESYRFFINFGTTTRTINSNFKLDGNQTSLNWRNYIKQKSGKGNVGLNRGGSNTVRYNDGYVGTYGLPSTTNPGGTGGYVTTGSQISSHPLGDPGGSLNRTLSFHTNDFHYVSSIAQRSVNVSDSDIGVGPYFLWGYHLNQFDSVLINFVSGGSYISTNHSSGSRNVANLSVTEKRSDYTYRYDYMADSAYPLSIPGSVTGPSQLIVTDPSLLFTGPGVTPPLNGSSYYQAPRQNESTSNSATTRFYAMSQADLDVNLSEIPFGFEIGREIGPVDIFFTGGTTVNIIDYDLSNSVNWYQSGQSNPIMRQSWRDSGTPIRMGFYSGLTVKVPLKRDGRVLLEAHSSYRWVDPVHASAGIADVEIDPSSWEAGVGIVIILE